MAQKLFVQECQSKGIQYQAVQPEVVMDVDTTEGELPDKIRPITKTPEGKPESRQKAANTQDGWRKFWAQKEKGRDASGKWQVVFGITGIAVLLLLAFALPEYGGRWGIADLPMVMDMQDGGETYVFHPEAYPDYLPLERQVEVLKSLGFQVPEELVTELKAEMDEMPMSRVWVEGYPYRGLLTMIGMPERDYEKGGITEYSRQAYWFDWEGLDMGCEYVYILEGINAMADGEFVISDAQQDMSDTDWENGSGIVCVRFCVNGVPFEYELKLEYDWLDPEIIGDINDALETIGAGRRVYAMGDGGQGCILVCADEEWAKRFRKETGIALE